MNTPFGNAVTTAEHAISMICALARQIPEADRSTQEGLWEKARFVGTELTGKTLGIIGCGNIGSIVADRAQGLKMKVAAFDPYLTEERAESIGVRKLELKPLLADSDFISLHTPLTEQTKNIINAEALVAMKRSAYYKLRAGWSNIGTGPQGCSEDGHVAGAALDGSRRTRNK